MRAAGCVDAAAGNELRMRNLIFLLADSQSRAADAITGSPLGCARRRPRDARQGSPRKGCQPTAPDRVPGCGGGRGRPLLPARGRTVAGGVLQHVVQDRDVAS